jgi:hypothetical protein
MGRPFFSVPHGEGVPVSEAVDRFMSRVMPIPESGCWLWTGHISRNGYGKFHDSGKIYLAHRFGYEMFIGQIPADLTLDHLCRVTSCVNPKHLEPVTMLNNIYRGNGACAINRRKTNCPQGHPYSPENTYKDRFGKRYCRRCRRDAKTKKRQTRDPIKRADAAIERVAEEGEKA